MNINKEKAYKIICNIVLLYPILNLIINCISNDRIKILNLPIIILFFIFIMLTYVIERKMFKMIFTVLLCALTVINANSITSFFSTDNLYFCFFIMYLIFIYKNDDFYKVSYEFFKAKEKVTIFTSLAVISMVIIWLFLGKGLYLQDNSTLSLRGPYSLNHSLAYTLLVMYAMCNCVRNKKNYKKILILKMIMTVMIIATAVRSAFLVLIIYLFLDFKRTNYSKKIIVCFLVLPILTVIGIYTGVLINNPLVKKTISAAERGTISNGRDEMTQLGRDYYFNETTMKQKITGIGMEKLRKIYLRHFGTALHAHNDLVNILLGYGFIYLIISAYLIISFSFSNNIKHSFLFMVSILLLAYTNGLFMYIIYVIGLPVVKIFYSENRLPDKEKNK